MATKQPFFDLYRDARKQWRWRLRARNGKIVADSAEGYKTKSAARRGIDLVMAATEIREATK